MAIEHIKTKHKEKKSLIEIGSLNSHYLGIVLSNNDATKMGKLSVFIPSINQNKELSTFSISYCSPFAGASQLSAGAQTSYGFWAVPGVGDQVAVAFLNGDPNNGFYMGCFYQQFMNNMIPGIPNATLTDGTTGPAKEYDKNGQYASDTNPRRPVYKELYDALYAQGLSGDTIRGTSTSGARRDTEPKVYGMLTPGGSQFVMDDNDSNKFIRFRTASGAQILIDDTVGNVYMITKNGNSWMELSDDGIDIYTSKTMNFRSQKDMNFHTDGNINMFSANSINATATFQINMGSGTSMNLLAGSQYNLQSGGKMSMSATGDLALVSDGTMGIDSGGDLALRGCGSIGVTSCDKIVLKTSKITMNGASGPTPISAVSPSYITPAYTSDRELNETRGYNQILTKTIVSRLPTHEPFEGHPTSSTSASVSGINDNISMRTSTTVDSNNVPSSSSSDTAAGSESTDTSDSNTDDSKPSDWWIPLSGVVSSIYGNNTGAHSTHIHQGVDIAAGKNSIIMASRAGKIIFAGSGGVGSGYNGYGNCVLIDHLDGYKTMYAHMNSVAVSENDTVTQGQTIGYCGSTGHSTGFHCHFEIRKGTNKINPATFMPNLGIKLKKVNAGAQ